LVSLVDIVPQTRTVQTAAGDLELRGIGLRQIADLFLQFPSLRNIFTEGAPPVSPAEIIIGAPDAIGTIVALSAGQPEAAAKIVDVGGGLTPDELFDCVQAICDLTFPRGISPFFLRLAPFMGLIADRPTGTDLDGGAPPAPNGSLPAGMSLPQ
jgi:hypothetical protein